MILSTIANTELQVEVEKILGKKGFPPTNNHRILYCGIPIPLTMERNLNAHFSLSVMSKYFFPKAPVPGTHTNLLTVDLGWTFKGWLAITSQCEGQG